MDKSVVQKIQELTGATSVVETEKIQTLWSGYGAIVRVALTSGSVASLIVKNIDLIAVSNHSRGWNTDLSHQRKVHSYAVEKNWYSDWNTHDQAHCRTARGWFTFSSENNHFIVMEDLDLAGFPVRKHHLSLSEVKVCLKWLAHFHGYYLDQKPSGLWQEGTYWHLDTRPDELAAMPDGPLKTHAAKINAVLRNCRFQTIVHGDAKVANFCFNEAATQVAAVDFQYVGGGCGMKDLIYFIGSCLDETECELYEEEILRFYFEKLKTAAKLADKQIDFTDLETEWRSMYSVAWADFTRFLEGWAPTHQKLHGYS